MRPRTIVASLFLYAFLLATAGAVPRGRVLTWDTSGGTVVFDGKSHAEKGMKCKDCHEGIFKRKQGTAAMTMKDLNEGKYCGACHDGKKSFNTTDAANCAKCHNGKE